MAESNGVGKYIGNFKIRHRADLPAIWQGGDEEFLAEASLQLGLAPEHLTDEVVFALPACTLSRAYQHFLNTGNRRNGDSIGVDLSDPDSFAAAFGPGALAEALNSLKTLGYPCHFVRMITPRHVPGGY